MPRRPGRTLHDLRYRDFGAFVAGLRPKVKRRRQADTAGAAVGAALGSAAGPVGSVIGAVVGGAVGAALASRLGAGWSRRALEERLVRAERLFAEIRLQHAEGWISPAERADLVEELETRFFDAADPLLE